MNKLLFVISDIHGFYEEMIKALQDAGFDENNEEHLLIVLGDIFDRGPDALRIYEYLKRLSDIGKAIVLKGNHDEMLINYLNGTSISPFNYLRNGTNETLGDFLHETSPFETWCLFNQIEQPTYDNFATWVSLARENINEEYPELLKWLYTRPYYYETKHFIFTHGAIDTTIPDWHNSDWTRCIWDDGTFFGQTLSNTDKTVVIGHFGTEQLRKMYGIENQNNPYEILVRDDANIVAIDATTVVSKMVNVCVLSDELIENERSDN